MRVSQIRAPLAGFMFLNQIHMQSGGYSVGPAPCTCEWKEKKSTDTSHQEAQLSKETIRIPCITNSYNEKSISHLKVYWTIYPFKRHLYTKPVQGLSLQH